MKWDEIENYELKKRLADIKSLELWNQAVRIWNKTLKNDYQKMSFFKKLKFNWNHGCHNQIKNIQNALFEKEFAELIETKNEVKESETKNK